MKSIFPQYIEITFKKRIQKMSAQGIVQYVLVRSDLCKTLGWPVGALVAQACHASTAAIHMFYEHEDTKKYLSDLDNMHKIILSVSMILNKGPNHLLL